MIGRRIDKYEILRTLGEGGMGAVYLARHVLLGRLAAVKVLLPELSSKQEMVARIFNEARLMGALHHPGLVDVYDFGHHEGCAYIVMEYLEGETLAALVDRTGRLPASLAIPLGRQIAAAVAVAHRNGIVHRDLKPENVFLVPDDETSIGLRARLLDFGIAKLAEERGAVRTRTGSLVGTPAYMSPEQCRGSGSAEIDGRSDIYALGCILFEMLCGRRVFQYDGLGELIAAQLHELPVAPRRIEPSIPEWLDALIVRCLSKQPRDRPQTMDELTRLLITASGVRPPPPVGEPPHAARGRTPTTFSRLSGETVEPTPIRRRAWWLVAPIALAVGAGAMWLAVKEPAGGATVPMPALAPPPPPPAPPPAPVVMVPDAGPPDAPPPDAAPPAAPPPDAAPQPPPPPAPRRPRPRPQRAVQDPGDVLDPYSESKH